MIFSAYLGMKPGGHAQKPRPSSGDLLSSAKVVADAAKASLRHESDNVDKGRVAGAAADLLGAASHYGKLEEKGMGKYVDKAEGYLRGYHSSHSAHATTAAGAQPSAATSHSSPSHASEAAHSAAAAAGAGGGKSGYGEYVKMAQGLLNTHSGGGGGSGAGAGAGGQHSGGGGYGEYIKLAEGFLKKH
ncbi:hypothetical protein Taro_006462 [Colocasia esculenta]|uniref:Nodulin-related protein 1 n=1 Tax=Colocasia esculenta TaxID=4460 RepID=A0A843U0W1_COLES|nr:hypothetical protein [Colocasia esculenta]